MKDKEPFKPFLLYQDEEGHQNFNSHLQDAVTHGNHLVESWQHYFGEPITRLDISHLLASANPEKYLKEAYIRIKNITVPGVKIKMEQLVNLIEFDSLETLKSHRDALKYHFDMLQTIKRGKVTLPNIFNGTTFTLENLDRSTITNWFIVTTQNQQQNDIVYAGLDILNGLHALKDNGVVMPVYSQWPQLIKCLFAMAPGHNDEFYLNPKIFETGHFDRIDRSEDLDDSDED